MNIYSSGAHFIKSVILKKCCSSAEFTNIENVLRKTYQISLVTYFLICLTRRDFIKYMVWFVECNHVDWHRFIMKNVTTVPSVMLELKNYNSPNDYMRCIFNNVVKNDRGEWVLQKRAAWSWLEYIIVKWDDAKKNDALPELLKPQREYIKKCQKIMNMLRYNNDFREVVRFLLNLKRDLVDNYTIASDIQIDALDLRSFMVDSDEKNRIEYIDDRYVLVKLMINDIQLCKIKSFFS